MAADRAPAERIGLAGLGEADSVSIGREEVNDLLNPLVKNPAPGLRITFSPSSEKSRTGTTTEQDL